MKEITADQAKQFVYKILVNNKFSGTGYLISRKGYVIANDILKSKGENLYRA